MFPDSCQYPTVWTKFKEAYDTLTWGTNVRPRRTVIVNRINAWKCKTKKSEINLSTVYSNKKRLKYEVATNLLRTVILMQMFYR